MDLRFEKNLKISTEKIFIDDVPFGINCEKHLEREVPGDLGSLKDAKIELILLCTRADGWVRVHLKILEKRMPILDVEVADNYSDEGKDWETRTLISKKAGTGRYSIEVMRENSDEDVPEGQPIKCDYSIKRYNWTGKSYEEKIEKDDWLLTKKSVCPLRVRT